MTHTALLDRLKGRLIVSCQPDADQPDSDPMNHAFIMAAYAQAAVLGGAAAIRADSPSHIAAIRAVTDVPIIGLYKRRYPELGMRITPSVADALAIAEAGADFIAVDGTARPRLEGQDAAEFIQMVVARTGKPVMADIATRQDAVMAQQAGACAVLTTLSGYTPESTQQEGPDFALVAHLAQTLRIAVIAEGRINSPQQAAQMMQAGAWAVTVGSAITRPKTITQWFVKALEGA